MTHDDYNNEDEQYYSGIINNLLNSKFSSLLRQIYGHRIKWIARALKLPLDTENDLAMAEFALITYDGYLSQFYAFDLEDSEVRAMKLTKAIIDMMRKYKMLDSSNRVRSGNKPDQTKIRSISGWSKKQKGWGD